MFKAKKFQRLLSMILCFIMTGSLFVTVFAGVPVIAQEANTISDEEINLTPNELSYLGYGYNILDGTPLKDSTSFKKFATILDMNNPLVKASITTTLAPGGGASNQIYYTSREAALAVGKGNTFGVSAELGISIPISVPVSVGANASLTTAFNQSNKTEKTMQEQFEVYYQLITKKEIMIQGLSLYQLQNCLSSSFMDQAKSIKTEAQAQEFFENFGTHLFTGYLLGGKLTVTNYKQSVSANEELKNSQTLETKMKAAANAASIGSAGAGTEYSAFEEYEKKEGSTTSTSSYKYTSIGGYQPTAMSVDQLFTYNPSMLDGKGGYEYQVWSDSINEGKDLGIVGFANGAKAYTVWDLLPQTEEYNLARQLLMQKYISLNGKNYEQFINENPYISANSTLGTSNSSLANIDGYYYQYDDNYYRVSKDDVAVHTVTPNSLLYMDARNDIMPANLTWKITKGAAYATVIDDKAGIIQINSDAIKDQEIMIEIYDGNVSKDCISVKVAYERYSGGIGTETYPYLISNADDIKFLARNESDWQKSFRLTNNIDLNGEEISGIGRVSNKFNGVFDGNYCSIYNFSIKEHTDGALGLFTFNSGTIKNLTIGSTDETTETIIRAKSTMGANYVGGVVGYNAGTVDNCKTIRVVATAQYGGEDASYSTYVGGVVGYNTGNITRCASINVTSSANIKLSSGSSSTMVYAGGLVGSTEGGKIENCYTYKPTCIQSYAMANSTAKAYQGMFAGRISATSVSNCVAAITDVNQKTNLPGATGSNVIEAKIGKFVGEYRTSGSGLTNCYAEDVSEKLDNIESEVRAINGKLTFDFAKLLSSDVWYANDGDSFPMLKCHQANYARLEVEVDNTYSNGYKDGFYKGSQWTPVGLKISRVEGDGSRTTIPFVIKNPYQNLESVENLTLTIEGMGLSRQQSLSVVKNDILGIAVGEQAGGEIYINDKFDPQKHAQGVEIYALLTNGESIPLGKCTTLFDESGIEGYQEDVNYIKNAEILYECELDSLGKKIVKVTYGVMSDENTVKHTANYLINCTERILEDVEVTYNDSIEYYEGDTFKKDSIAVIATYKNGTGTETETVVLPLDQVEVVSSIIKEGTNTISVMYQDRIKEINVVGLSNGNEPETPPTDDPNEGGTTPPTDDPNEGGTTPPTDDPNEGGTTPPTDDPNEGGTTPPTDDPNEGGTTPSKKNKADTNGDGKVTYDDAVAILRFIHFTNVYSIENGTGDVNGDGKITSDDAIYIKNYLLAPNDYPIA